MPIQTDDQKQAQEKYYRQKYPKAFLTEFELSV